MVTDQIARQEEKCVLLKIRTVGTINGVLVDKASRWHFIASSVHNSWSDFGKRGCYVLSTYVRKIVLRRVPELYIWTADNVAQFSAHLHILILRDTLSASTCISRCRSSKRVNSFIIYLFYFLIMLLILNYVYYCFATYPRVFAYTCKLYICNVKWTIYCFVTLTCVLLS